MLFWLPNPTEHSFFSLIKHTINFNTSKFQSSCMSSFEFFVTEKNVFDFDFAPPLLLHPRDSPWRVHRCCKRGNYVLFLSPNFPNVWCTHVRLRWYSYTWNLPLSENRIPINVFRRPTESSHQIHASLCVPLIQVHPKIDVEFFFDGYQWSRKYVHTVSVKALPLFVSMTHSQMLGKVKYGLPAKIWRLVGCTKMLSW